MLRSRVLKKPTKGQKRRLVAVRSLICETAVLPVNYPEISLAEYNKEEFISALFDKVDGLKVSDGISPKFGGLEFRRGGFIITCIDPATKVWVNKIASSLQLGNGISLRATDPGILCRDAVVCGYFQGPKLSPELFFRRLTIQNVELSDFVEKWTIESADLRDNGFFVVFKMPEEHLEELSKREFTISYYFSAAKLLLLDMVSKDTDKKIMEEQGDVKKGSIEMEEEVRAQADVREASTEGESADLKQIELMRCETADKSLTNKSYSDEDDLYSDELFIYDE